MGLQAGADQMPAWTAPCPPEAQVAAIALREHPEGQPFAPLCRLVCPDLCGPGRQQVTASTAGGSSGLCPSPEE